VPDSPRSAELSLIYMVGRVNQGIRRELRTRLSEWGLSVQEYTTMSILDARPELSNAQLARRALVTPQSMIEILSKLEDRELVARVVDPAHGRILRARLTPSGKSILRAADPTVKALQSHLLEGVSAADQERVREALRQAMERLSGIGDGPGA
jgi:DNA-binding MarR family transcriptional regulator